jgi:hypothetical protein
MSIMEIGRTAQNMDQNQLSNAIGDLMMTLLNPAFFLMSAGVMICRAGGTMMLTSRQIMNEFIPGMIILETTRRQESETTIQPSPSQSDDSIICGNCNKPMEYIEQYDRFYCYDCQEYAPKDA